MFKTSYLNGYQIYPFKSRDDLLGYLVEETPDEILVALNAEKVMKDDDRLKNLVNENIGYSDGTGPVLALKRKGVRNVKIPGTELWLNIIQEFYQNKTFYLVGGKQNVIETTVSKLQRKFPGIDIVNYRNGYMNAFEQKRLIGDIVSKKPSIVFVAMGSPKQEFLMQKMHKHHKALYMGLGGSFDVYTDKKNRAPKLLREMGLEWSYRLFKEPARIFRQTSLVTFAVRMLGNKL